MVHILYFKKDKGFKTNTDNIDVYVLEHKSGEKVKSFKNNTFIRVDHKRGTFTKITEITKTLELLKEDGELFKQVVFGNQFANMLMNRNRLIRKGALEILVHPEKVD